MAAQPDLDGRLRGAAIVSTGMYVPERVLTNLDFERMVDTSDEWILERTGIRERRIAAPEQASSDLAVEASLRALETAGVEPGEVDQIILATTTPDRYLPSCACTVQDRLGAARAAAYDVFAACSGFIYGLGLARSLIAARQADTILLIGVEILSKIVDYADRNTCVLFGDGAGAAVLRPCAAQDGVLSVHMQSDGSLGELLDIPAGGSRRPASRETVDAREHFIHMKGKELFKVAVRAMSESAFDSLRAAGARSDEIELLIPHQANLRIMDAVRERLGLPPERVLVNIDRYGNTSSASIPISLDEVVREGRLKRGDIVQFVAFGGGVTWGASVVRWAYNTAPAVAAPVAMAKAAR
jgi:3-oxoacyl-[acyl-carrier-protein] synthase-3